MNFQFLTLFPDVFTTILSSSLLGKAQQSGRISFQINQIRDFATDRHRTVDDTPYGGGEGMLIKVDVLYAAWKAAVGRIQGPYQTVLMSPQGRLLTQDFAKKLLQYQQFY